MIKKILTGAAIWMLAASAVSLTACRIENKDADIFKSLDGAYAQYSAIGEAMAASMR